MAQANEPKPKLESLQRHRLLHSRPDSVTDESFVDNDFFDPNDLLQVKYEMRLSSTKQPKLTGHMFRSTPRYGGLFGG